MKKILKTIMLLLSLCLLTMISSDVQPTQANETIAVNDQLIVFKIKDTNYYTQTIGSDVVNTVKMDTAPIIELNRTFVPVRFLGNALGVNDSNINWNNATRTATLQGINKLDLTIGKKAIIVNDQEEASDVAPMITNSRTMLPARFVAEGLGFKVDWDADNQLVIVYQGERPDVSAIVAKIKGIKPVEEPKLPPIKTTEKIKDTPFYQASVEQIEACKNAPMPVWTTYGFNKMDKYDCQASYDYWGYVHGNLPYKFVTDKSLVYMSNGAANFRGYININNGWQMVDIDFVDKSASILSVPSEGKPTLIEKVRWRD